MQRVVFDEAYQFIPPHRGGIWPRVFKPFLKPYLRRSAGIVDYDIRGLDHLNQSLTAGHGIILAPNHCRPCDPMVMGMLTLRAPTFLHTMASWHVFKQDWMTAFVIRRLGAFSIYREGMDRTALNCAIEILVGAERPLVVFPEGVISRSNDHLSALMDGLGFIARTAAKKRQKQDPQKRVVIHPVALKYELLTDAVQALQSVLGDLERRLCWNVDPQRPVYERVVRLGQALMSLKEVEYLGLPQTGSLYDRAQGLINHLLRPLEAEWLSGNGEGDVVGRVKRLRSAILPAMVNEDLGENECQRRWAQLAQVYLAQQLSLYPRDYLRRSSPRERLLETVERFEEDLTDVSRVHGPLKVYLEVGPPLEVPTTRQRDSDSDALIDGLHDRLSAMLDDLSREVETARAQAERGVAMEASSG